MQDRGTYASVGERIMPYTPTIDARETAILTRAIQPEERDLSPAAARALLQIELHPDDRRRLHELLIKNQDDQLSAEERGELDSYLHVGLVVDLIQAKARAALRQRPNRAARRDG